MYNSKPSIYEKMTIQSADGSRSADIDAGAFMVTYYENLFSPIVTAKINVVNTGDSIVGKDGKMQSIYNGFPLRGGERVVLKIAGNSDVNKEGLDFSKNPRDYFYVASITNVLIDSGREIFTLNLVPREAITNETTRVGKKFPGSQTISDSVKNIIKDSHLVINLWKTILNQKLAVNGLIFSYTDLALIYSDNNLNTLAIKYLKKAESYFQAPTENEECIIHKNDE